MTLLQASRPWPLLCHTTTPSAISLDVVVHLSQTATALNLCFKLRGETDRLRIPALSAAGPAHGLWQHTCMELFVTQPNVPSYREFNFSPSGQWAAYCFAEERQRDQDAESTDPLTALHIDRQEEHGLVALTVKLPISALPQGHGAWLFGLSVVVERDDGLLSYWALHHPRPDRPDFHHRDSFVLPLTGLPVTHPSL